MTNTFSINAQQEKKLVRALSSLKSTPEKKARIWAEDCAEKFRTLLVQNLDTQGRSGQGPPLAEATLEQYAEDSLDQRKGITDSIQVRRTKSTRNYRVTVGIPSGTPTMIATVQNYGCLIRKGEGTFYVPGRSFWDLASNKIIRYSKRKIVVFLKKK